MNENNIDSIKNHLEFLGYSVIIEDNEGKKSITAKSSNKPTLVARFGKANEQSFVLFTCSYNGLKKVDSLEQYKFVNTMNMRLTLNTVFIDNSGDLGFSAAYTGEYNKKAFGDFIDLFLDGITLTMRKEEFNKLFLDSK